MERRGKGQEQPPRGDLVLPPSEIFERVKGGGGKWERPILNVLKWMPPLSPGGANPLGKGGARPGCQEKRERGKEEEVSLTLHKRGWTYVLFCAGVKDRRKKKEGGKEAQEFTEEMREKEGKKKRKSFP